MLYTHNMSKVVWTKNVIEQAKRLRRQGKSLQIIGDVFGVTRERIRQIVGNTGWINRVKYPIGFHRCSSCKKTLPVTNFYVSMTQNIRTLYCCKECLKTYSRKWSKRYSYKYKKGGKYFEQAKARNYLNYALSRKMVKKGNCVVGFDCSGRIEGHHYLGYDKKHYLDVLWFCSKHHGRADRNKEFEKAYIDKIVNQV